MKAAIYYGPEDIRYTQIDDARIHFAHSILVNASFIRWSEMLLCREVDEHWRDRSVELIDKHGFDKVIKMVGYPETLHLSIGLVWPGGTVAALEIFYDDTFKMIRSLAL